VVVGLLERVDDASPLKHETGGEPPHELASAQRQLQYVRSDIAAVVVADSAVRFQVATLERLLAKADGHTHTTGLLERINGLKMQRYALVARLVRLRQAEQALLGTRLLPATAGDAETPASAEAGRTA
jgi:hypothetical protein